MNNDHLCSNTVATQNHDVEDAPDFTEDEKRDEAKLILSGLLIGLFFGFVLVRFSEASLSGDYELIGWMLMALQRMKSLCG